MLKLKPAGFGVISYWRLKWDVLVTGIEKGRCESFAFTENG